MKVRSLAIPVAAIAAILLAVAVTLQGKAADRQHQAPPNRKRPPRR